MGLNVQNSGIQKLAETSSLRILEMSLTQKKHNFEQKNIFLASFVFVGGVNSSNRLSQEEEDGMISNRRFNKKLC